MSTRRTRAHPSPSGLQILADPPKRTRRKRKTAQELFAAAENANDATPGNDADDMTANVESAATETQEQSFAPPVQAEAEQEPLDDPAPVSTVAQTSPSAQRSAKAQKLVDKLAAKGKSPAKATPESPTHSASKSPSPPHILHPTPTPTPTRDFAPPQWTTPDQASAPAQSTTPESSSAAAFRAATASTDDGSTGDASTEEVSTRDASTEDASIEDAATENASTEDAATEAASTSSSEGSVQQSDAPKANTKSVTTGTGTVWKPKLTTPPESWPLPPPRVSPITPVNQRDAETMVSSDDEDDLYHATPLRHPAKRPESIKEVFPHRDNILKGRVAKKKKPFDRQRAKEKADAQQSGSDIEDPSPKKAVTSTSAAHTPATTPRGKTARLLEKVKKGPNRHTFMSKDEKLEEERRMQAEQERLKRLEIATTASVTRPSMHQDSSSPFQPEVLLPAVLGRPARLLTAELTEAIHLMADWQNHDPDNNVIPKPDELAKMLETYKAKTKYTTAEAQTGLELLRPRVSFAVPASDSDNAEETSPIRETAQEEEEETSDADSQADESEGDVEMTEGHIEEVQLPHTPPAQPPPVEEQRDSSWFRRVLGTPLSSLIPGRNQAAAQPDTTNGAPATVQAGRYNLDYQPPETPVPSWRGRRRATLNGPAKTDKRRRVISKRPQDFSNIPQVETKYGMVDARSSVLGYNGDAVYKQLPIHRWPSQSQRGILTHEELEMIKKYRDFEEAAAMELSNRQAQMEEARNKARVTHEEAQLETEERARAAADPQPGEKRKRNPGTYGFFPEDYSDSSDEEDEDEPEMMTIAKKQELMPEWTVEWITEHDWEPPQYRPVWETQEFDPVTVDPVTGIKFPNTEMLQAYKKQQHFRTDPYTGRVFQTQQSMKLFQLARKRMDILARAYSAEEDSYTEDAPCYYTGQKLDNIFRENGTKGAKPVFFHNLSYLPPPGTYERPVYAEEYDGCFPDEPPRLDETPPPPGASYRIQYIWKARQEQAFHPWLGHYRGRSFLPNTAELHDEQQALDAALEMSFDETIEWYKTNKVPLPPNMMKSLKMKHEYQEKQRKRQALWWGKLPIVWAEPDPRPLQPLSAIAGSQPTTTNVQSTVDQPAIADESSVANDRRATVTEVEDESIVQNKSAQQDQPAAGPILEPSVPEPATTIPPPKPTPSHAELPNQPIAAPEPPTASAASAGTISLQGGTLGPLNFFKPKTPSKLKEVWNMSPLQQEGTDKEKEQAASAADDDYDDEDKENDMSWLGDPSNPGYQVDAHVEDLMDNLHRHSYPSLWPPYQVLYASGWSASKFDSDKTPVEAQAHVAFDEVAYGVSMD